MRIRCSAHPAGVVRRAAVDGTGLPRLRRVRLGGLCGLSGLVLLGLAGRPAAQEKPSGIEAWFPHLRVGMWVKVEGPRMPDGALLATEIKILDTELDEVEVESYVAAVDLVRLTLDTTLGVHVVASASTEMKGPKQQPAVSFAFLQVGDRVDVEGQLQKDGSLAAEEIEIEKSKRLRPDLEPKNEHEMRSRVESIDAERRRIVLFGIPVQLSADTRNKSPLLD